VGGWVGRWVCAHACVRVCVCVRASARVCHCVSKAYVSVYEKPEYVSLSCVMHTRKHTHTHTHTHAQHTHTHTQHTRTHKHNTHTRTGTFTLQTVDRFTNERSASVGAGVHALDFALVANDTLPTAAHLQPNTFTHTHLSILSVAEVNVSTGMAKDTAHVKYLGDASSFLLSGAHLCVYTYTCVFMYVYIWVCV